MTDDDARRFERLAERAKQLDDVIKKAAEMQKHIVEEIRQIGQAQRLKPIRVSPTPKPRAKRRTSTG
jgi:uncharacterized protein YdcH (DUF465 family)